MLAMKIDCHKDLISHDEFSAFIKGKLVPGGVPENRNFAKFVKG
jgi:hypothetical protein